MKNKSTKEYLECSSCGYVSLKIKGETWTCKRCKSHGLISELRKFINENPEKIHQD
jgi:predicted ATP-dependent serine protease